MSRKRLALLSLLAGAGCSERPAPYLKSPPPLGFIYTCESPTGFPPGTTIYNTSGGVVGVVVKLDANHRFPDGTTGLGVYLKRPLDNKAVWYSGTAIENGLFVKK